MPCSLLLLQVAFSFSAFVTTPLVEFVVVLTHGTTVHEMEYSETLHFISTQRESCVVMDFIRFAFIIPWT